MRPLLSLVFGALLISGCGSVPYRYEAADAATLAGEYLAGGTNSVMVIEVNGERREPPFSPAPIKVRPGLLRVGLNLHAFQRYSTGCVVIDAAPGSFYQFSVAVEKDGFRLLVYQEQGGRRKLLGSMTEAFRPFRESGQVYCPEKV